MNVSLANSNAIKFLGFQSVDITSAQDISQAQAIIFPGQGSFRQAINVNSEFEVYIFVQGRNCTRLNF